MASRTLNSFPQPRTATSYTCGRSRIWMNFDTRGCDTRQEMRMCGTEVTVALLYNEAQEPSDDTLDREGA